MTMPRQRLHASWLESFESRMDPVRGIPKVLQRLYGPGSVEEQIRKTFSPGATASSALEYALDVGCVAPDHPMVAHFLAWSLDFCTQVLRNDEAWRSKYAMPDAQRSTVRGVLALSRAILENQDIDAELLAAGRQDAVAAFADAFGDHWEGISQSQYLFSVQFCLLEPDPTKATTLLDCGRGFAETRRWHDWLATLVGNLTESGTGPLTDATAIEHFDRRFDELRNPAFKRVEDMRISRALQCVQLAALRRKWIEGAPLKGSWREVLLSISNP